MENENETAAVTTTKRKRGRPATGRKTEEDKRRALAKSEELNLPQYGGRPTTSTLEILKEGISLLDIPPVNLYDPDEVKERTLTYLNRCYEYNRKPAIAAYALYLGIPRTTLKSFVEGSSNAIDSRSLATIKAVYAIVDTTYEQQMTDGDMNVVAGIFLMRNNLGYTNVDTVEIVPKAADTNTLKIDDVVEQYTTNGE